MQFREHQLANGLEIVAECNPNAHTASLGFFVRTGSRDENDSNWGVSHFLEHMTFKGTAKRSAADVNRELDEIGSSSNAYTTEEQTVYYATVLSEYQERALELLADIMRPALRTEDFDMEKQVILEEIAKYEDQPPFGANEKVMAAHFGSHPLSRSVLGTVKSVGDLTPEQMRAYFDERYSPNNMVLVAAGHVDFDRLISAADNLCGLWPTFETARLISRAQHHTGFGAIKNDLATQEYVVQVTNGPAAEDEERYAARLLSLILGDESGSRLYWDLVETGIAEYAAMESYGFQGTGVFMTFLCCEPAATEANLKQIHQTWLAAESDGVKESEVKQAKNKLCAHIILSAERASSRLFSVGGNWIKRRSYQTVRETVDAFQKVKREDIDAVLEQFPLSKNTTVCVGPHDQIAPPT